MDAIAYKEVFDFKHSGKLPEGISRNAKIVFRRKAKNFIIQNEVLHYVRRKEGGALAKVVCTKEKAKYIFMELHNSAIGAHCGIHKTFDAVSRRFYWPGMSVDIKKWITHCAACQQKQRSLKNQTQYTPIEVAEPWEIVGMDLVGKLTPTKDGYQYICAMVDYFTKWCEAFPLKSKRAEEVTECIIKLFYKFGAPKRLLTDQGTEFVNQINLEVCQTLGISRSLCAPYHPQTNGLVERLNGTIQRTLSKLVERKPSSWADNLEATMFGLRTKKQLTTKFSPYFLLFGREARYPCEVPDKYEINESVEELIAEECISECVKRRDRLYQVVKENMVQVHAKIKKRKLQGKARILQVGDRVLRQNIRSQQRKGGKLDLDYVGPYTVLNVDDKSIDLIDDNGKIYPKVNLDHLVHFQEEPPTKAPKVTYVTTSLPASMPSVPVLTPVTVKCPSFQTHLTFTHPVTLPITQFSLHHLTLPFTLPIVSSQSHTMTQPASSLPAASKPASSLPAASKPASSLPAASQLTLLHDIWAGKIGGRIWSKIGPFKLFSMDLERLRPGEELESEVINAYLACLAKSYAGHAFVIDSFQMTKMWNGKACLMKRTDLQKYDLLLGSVNETHHWTLLLIYPQQGRIIYMNSLGEGSNKLVHCCKAVRDFMDHKGFQGTTWKCVTLPHNLQPDSNSCGVFVCKFAEAILTGGNLNFPCDPENIAVMREDIGQRLLNESEDLSDSCLACGNEYPYTEDKVDTWIECDRCSGWYHWDCMSRPSIEAVFICPGCQGPF